VQPVATSVMVHLEPQTTRSAALVMRLPAASEVTQLDSVDAEPGAVAKVWPGSGLSPVVMPSRSCARGKY